MKWILVYITIAYGEPMAVNAMGPRYYFDTIHDCFWMREAIAEKVGGQDGYYPPGKQAICIKYEVGQ